MWKTFLYSDRFSQGKRYWKRKPQKLVDDGKSKQLDWQNYYKNTYTTTKLIYRFNAIPIKILILDFTGLEKRTNQEFPWTLRRPESQSDAEEHGLRWGCHTQQQSTHCHRMKNARGADVKTARPPLSRVPEEMVMLWPRNVWQWKQNHIMGKKRFKKYHWQDWDSTCGWVKLDSLCIKIK